MLRRTGPRYTPAERKSGRPGQVHSLSTCLAAGFGRVPIWRPTTPGVQPRWVPDARLRTRGYPVAAKITRPVLEGYLECGYKGWLRLAGEPEEASDYQQVTAEEEAEARS